MVSLSRGSTSTSRNYDIDVLMQLAFSRYSTSREGRYFENKSSGGGSIKEQMEVSDGLVLK